jgi:hypothetical protein
LDFFTTLRSAARGTFGGAAVAALVCSSAETTRPEITAADPTTALRIRKVRRSTPAGTSRASNSAPGSKGVSSSRFADFISAPWRTSAV